MGESRHESTAREYWTLHVKFSQATQFEMPVALALARRPRRHENAAEDYALGRRRREQAAEDHGMRARTM